MKAAGKINGMNARCRSWLPVSRNLSPAKAVLKSPHSRRFARIDDLLSARQRLDCGVFTAAFGRRRFMVAMRVQSWRSRLSIDPSFGVPRLRGPDRLKAELQTKAATTVSNPSMCVANGKRLSMCSTNPVPGNGDRTPRRFSRTAFLNRSSRRESARTFPEFRWSGLTSAATWFMVECDACPAPFGCDFRD